MSTPQFIPRRERDAARRRPADAAIESCIQRDVSRVIIPPYLAVGEPDESDRLAAGRGVRLAADLVALSTLVSMRAPREIL